MKGQAYCLEASLGKPPPKRKNIIWKDLTAKSLRETKQIHYGKTLK